MYHGHVTCQNVPKDLGNIFGYYEPIWIIKNKNFANLNILGRFIFAQYITNLGLAVPLKCPRLRTTIMKKHSMEAKILPRLGYDLRLTNLE